MLAVRHYAKEAKLFKTEARWWFRSGTEAVQAIEYVCRRWDVKAPLVKLKASHGRWGGGYSPAQFLLRAYPEILLYRDQLNLRVVAHELAHHLDAENMIATRVWFRDFPRRGHRWHRAQHLKLMRDVVDLIRRKYGNRTPGSCARARSTVKVRS